MYNNNNAEEVFVCMACTGDIFDKQYNNNDIDPHPSVLSDADVVPIIYPNFFNDTINDSCGWSYINANLISNT